MEYTASYIVPSNDIYTAEKILKRRKNAHGFYEYLIKWKGYTKRESTWEPESNILDPLLVDEFVAKSYANKSAVKDMKGRLRKKRRRMRSDSDYESFKSKTTLGKSIKHVSFDGDRNLRINRFNIDLRNLISKKKKIESVINSLTEEDEKKRGKGKDLKMIISCKNGLVNIKNKSVQDTGRVTGCDTVSESLSENNQDGPKLIEQHNGPTNVEPQNPEEKVNETDNLKTNLNDLTNTPPMTNLPVVVSPKATTEDDSGCKVKYDDARSKSGSPYNIFLSKLFTGDWNYEEGDKGGTYDRKDDPSSDSPLLSNETGGIPAQFETNERGYVFPLSPPPSLRSFGGSSPDTYSDNRMDCHQQPGNATYLLKCKKLVISDSKEADCSKNFKEDVLDIERDFPARKPMDTRPSIIVHSDSYKRTKALAIPYDWTTPTKIDHVGTVFSKSRGSEDGTTNQRKEEPLKRARKRPRASRPKIAGNSVPFSTYQYILPALESRVTSVTPVNNIRNVQDTNPANCKLSPQIFKRLATTNSDEGLHADPIYYRPLSLYYNLNFTGGGDLLAPWKGHYYSNGLPFLPLTVPKVHHHGIIPHGISHILNLPATSYRTAVLPPPVKNFNFYDQNDKFSINQLISKQPQTISITAVTHTSQASPSHYCPDFRNREDGRELYRKNEHLKDLWMMPREEGLASESSESSEPKGPEARVINDYFIKPTHHKYLDGSESCSNISGYDLWRRHQERDVVLTDVTAKSLTVTFKEYDVSYS